MPVLVHGWYSPFHEPNYIVILQNPYPKHNEWLHSQMPQYARNQTHAEE